MLSRDGQSSSRAKKYLLKLKMLKEQPLTRNRSMFHSLLSNQSSDNQSGFSLQKYRSLATTVDKTVTIQTHIDTLPNPSRLKDSKTALLPSLNSKKNHQINQKTLRNDTLTSNYSPQGRNKNVLKSFLHNQTVDSPEQNQLRARLQKTPFRRASDKHKAYRKLWNNSSNRRRDKSLLQRSAEKASISVKHINIDARYRINNPSFEDIVRDHKNEKTFIELAVIQPEVKGLKGRGGRIVPLFDEVFMTEEVYKFQK